MIRIAALNEESEDESESEKEEVTREALEEIALQQYARTLELQKKGNYKDALKLLQDLLDTELLYEVEKPLEKDNITRPLLNLKYLCYRNVASISSQLGDYESAIEAYLEASELDDSDITLWYRLGKISLQCQKFELASFAFQRGVECNPKHWPCIDNLITVLLGLGNYNDCIYNIYKALELDPNYFRGRAYRKHIFTDYKYLHEYLIIINPMFKWKLEDDDKICGEKYDKLIKQAYVINEEYINNVNKNKIVELLPVLSLNKPIKKLSWLSLGESLTDMHLYITENLLSHASVVEIGFPDKKIDDVAIEPMDVDQEVKVSSSPLTENATSDIKIEVEKVDDNKANSETEKEQNDQDNQGQEGNKSGNEGKDTKKGSTRRRGSSLSFLEQWEWCTKRRSSRKKTVNRQDRNDENVYETLKRVLPNNLLSDDMKPKKNKELNADNSMDTMDIYKLFEEKEQKASDILIEEKMSDDTLYFNTDKEESDVENFIKKYIEFKCDIIEMLDEYVLILSKYWNVKLPSNLGDVFTKANRCSKQHYNPPHIYDNADDKINKFINTNLLHLEVEVDGLLKKGDDKSEIVDVELIDTLRFLCTKFEGNASENVDVIIRYLWVRCHAYLYQDNTEFSLDCLYQMMYELNCLEDSGESYALQVPNFICKPLISKNVIIDLLKSLETNKRLSTVLHMYEMEKYEEILPILQNSFKHCQMQANKQEWSEMGLDWAVHLVILLEILWNLENTEQCFIWALACLHEALKQYLLCTPGNTDYDKWSMTVIKILMTIEHIVKKEGSFYFEVLPNKALELLVQDIVQIIVHQLDDSNSTEEMPIKTAVPWVLLHYILQREEDCGRMSKKVLDNDAADREDIPPSLMVLFTGHDYLGKKGWCCVNDGYLLYFTLNTVIPRLRSPALLNVLETVSQCLEQIVFCLFGHPSKKTKTRYLYDHNVTPSKLDWNLAQQIFELYRPYEMPEFNSYRLGSISSETEQLFQRMLSLLPSSCDPQPYIVEVIAYIENKKDVLPSVTFNYPYKIRDVYYLLADYYLKNNETIKALKYYTYDIVLSKCRFNSWAGIALARASLLETKLNSCETFKTEMEYLNRAAAVERCFKKALEIDASHSMLWIEYGAFVYGVHSFCSRMLKQASESLSMENFETLEKRKNDMLNTAHKCFVSANREWMIEFESEDKTLQDERWLHYYMLGKISEKMSDPPAVYLEHYIKAGKFLLENNATYPSKINYNNPQNLSVEALEIHYRIHASILKYIEQHENKSILGTVGKSFKDCLAKCLSGPFSKKKQAKEIQGEKEPEISNVDKDAENVNQEKIVNDASNNKRSLETSDDSETSNKKPKVNENVPVEKIPEEITDYSKDLVRGDMLETAGEVVVCTEKDSTESIENGITDTNEDNMQNGIQMLQPTDTIEQSNEKDKNIETIEAAIVSTEMISNGDESKKDDKYVVSDSRRTSQESTTTNTATSKDDSSSDSSSSSSSDDSSSDSSSVDTSNESNAAKTDAEKVDTTEMTHDEICEIIAICLDNLEDCVSRFPQHYKALYRLAHYHFYYKKDKNVERCRDLMLGSFVGRNTVKLQGLFCERKNSNFFNAIWRIPASEIDRPGSFASHMSRCVLITMEILKEVDDHKTLLDLSMQLQKTPEAEKKYLRDSERSELSQQAFSLCTRSLKALFAKYGQQSTGSLSVQDRKSISNFMLDVYRSYQKVQKHNPSKVQTFSSLLIDCHKLLTTGSTNNESTSLEHSIRYCQSYISVMKQQASHSAAVSSSTTSNSTVTVIPVPAKKPAKQVEQMKLATPAIPTTSFLPTLDLNQSFAKNMFNQNIANPLMNYMPTMDPLLSAISYHVSNMENMGYSPSTNVNTFRSLQQLISSSLTNTFTPHNIKPTPGVTITKSKSSDLLKNIKASQTSNLKRSLSVNHNYIHKPKTHKNASYYQSFNASQMGTSKSTTSAGTSSKATVSQLLKSTAATLAAMPGHSSSATNIYNVQMKAAHTPIPQPVANSAGLAKPAHMNTSSTVGAALHTKPPLPHQQISPGKTLQEKLAERQKQNPNLPKSSKKPNSPMAIATAAFSGKIPASLTITKSATGKPAPVSNVDTSEVIILDDD